MMMMGADPKKMATLIISESPREKEVSQGLEADMSPAFEAVAKDILKAIEGKDAKLLVMAMKEFDALCEEEENYLEEE